MVRYPASHDLLVPVPAHREGRPCSPADRARRRLRDQAPLQGAACPHSIEAARTGAPSRAPRRRRCALCGFRTAAGRVACLGQRCWVRAAHTTPALMVQRSLDTHSPGKIGPTRTRRQPGSMRGRRAAASGARKLHFKRGARCGNGSPVRWGHESLRASRECIIGLTGLLKVRPINWSVFDKYRERS